MRFAWIRAEEAHWPVRTLCKVLEVSSAGFYAWNNETHGPKPQELQLRAKIREIHRRSRGAYWSPRVHAELRRQGVKVGCRRVIDLMRQEGLEGRSGRKRVKTTDSRHALPVAPDRAYPLGYRLRLVEIVRGCRSPQALARKLRQKPSHVMLNEGLVPLVNGGNLRDTHNLATTQTVVRGGRGARPGCVFAKWLEPHPFARRHSVCVQRLRRWRSRLAPKGGPLPPQVQPVLPRMKDLYNLELLRRTFSFEHWLQEAVAATFARRRTPVPAEVPSPSMA